MDVTSEIKQFAPGKDIIYALEKGGAKVGRCYWLSNHDYDCYVELGDKKFLVTVNEWTSFRDKRKKHMEGKE